MEGLVSNITNTCTTQFSGVAGGIFAQAIASVIAAQCLTSNGHWPIDRAKDLLNQKSGKVEYDFVIIGAGTAGSLLASRLSNMFKDWSILLIEAGNDPGIDSEIPAFLFLNQNTNLDWNYWTEPDENCKGFQGQTCLWSKGRGMGGSSSINAMIYIRGHHKDFEAWENMGNKNWSYRDVLPYFEKVEKTLEIQNYTKISTENPLYEVLRMSWKELGFDESTEIYEANAGPQIAQLLINKGKRVNTAKMYLNKASKSENLHVFKDTTVQRLIIDPESRSVKSIEIKHTSGILMQIHVRKEVFLSAGSIATPKILLLSGIGPSDHLTDIGVKTITDLPVGKNLQDHSILPLLFQMNSSKSLDISNETIVLSLIQYILLKTGPFTTIGITDLMNFVNTLTHDYPNIQYHHTFFPKNDKFMLKPYFEGVGYTRSVINAIEYLNRENSLVGIYPTLLHPKSRGEILLANSDPDSKPIIKPRYFSNEDDMVTMIKSIRIAQTLTNTTVFRSLGIQLNRLNLESCDTLPFDSDIYWNCYIKHMATTIYHPVGTAAMGSDASNSVVNDKLQVHGIENLRVVDASVMPTITGGNTMAPTLMIAEKAADLIKHTYATEFLFKEDL